MCKVNLEISEDDVIVLFEFFERFAEKAELYFVHTSEYISLMKISAQTDKGTSVMFDKNYKEILKQSREKIADRFESDFLVIREE